MAAIEFVSGDITSLNIDAIVYPAHKHLIRGRGLSAQIFDRVGEPLIEACNQLDDCPIGQARITEGFNLPAQHIIHTVSPQWSGGDQWGVKVLQQLRECYENSLALAREHGITRLAFASLGSGGNKIPQALASNLALDVLHRHLDEFDQLVMCLSSDASLHAWQAAEQQQHFYH